MTHFAGLQLLGYAASILIAASLLMRSIVRLRIVNMAGAATFAVYGFLIGAWPVGILNSLTTLINVVQLIRLRRRTEIFRILEIASDSPYLRYFLEFQSADIHRFFPNFPPERWSAATSPRRDDQSPLNALVLLVLRDLIPAGLLLAMIDGHTLRVDLDYVVPQYRDLKVGGFLFVDQAPWFRSRGIDEILSPADTEAHAHYLERVGFRSTADPRMYRLDVSPQESNS